MKTRCVLVIDDDAFYAHCLKQALAPAGIECLHANAVEAGMEMVRRLQPDAVLVSLLINGLDGSELLTALKSDAETRAIPVMMLAHVGMREDIDRCLERGACNFLIKSQQNSDELLSSVQNLFSEE